MIELNSEQMQDTNDTTVMIKSIKTLKHFKMTAEIDRNYRVYIKLNWRDLLKFLINFGVQRVTYVRVLTYRGIRQLNKML